MIIILDGRGAVLNKEFEKINQGSNNSNKIHVIAPFPVNSVLNASFELPNGYVTSNYLMSPLMAINEVLNVWELSITDVAMTQYYGLVKFQIKAINDGITIATAKGLFKVEEGVDWQLPQTPDETTYVQILSALTRVDEAVVNKVNINYTSEDNTIEQMVINSSLGLKLVKTKNGQTTTFEVKENGCYVNGKLIANIDDLSAVENKIPTKVSELENNSGFVDNSVDNLINYYLKAETYTKEEVNQIVNAIKTISFEIVDNLPESGQSNIIYLLPKTSSTNNVYEEYIYVNNKWELIGATEIDLSNYYDITVTDMLLEDLERRTTLNSLNFQPSENDLIYSDGKAYIQGQFTYTTKESPSTAVGIDGTLVVNIKGGDGVIVDADEENNTLEIHIDNNIVNTDEIQEITGVKTFLEQIGLKNTNDDVDLIKHINNNFLITSASGQSLLNIDEQLEKIYAFNKEIAFKDDVVYTLDGTTLTITTK